MHLPPPDPAWAPFLSPSAIAFAALVSALTVVIGALIAARTARVVARDTFRRQILQESLKPFLAGLDNQIVVYEQFTEAGGRLVKLLEALIKAKPEEREAKKEAALTFLNELLVVIDGSNKLWDSTAGLSVVARDQKVIDTAVRWLEANRAVLDLRQGNAYSITADAGKVAEMKKAAQDAKWKAVELRIALEEVVIQPRGMVSRAAYWMSEFTKKWVGRAWKATFGWLEAA